REASTIRGGRNERGGSAKTGEERDAQLLEMTLAIDRCSCDSCYVGRDGVMGTDQQMEHLSIIANAHPTAGQALD
ncbi:hypothetical protein PMAYCL1PPCAC_15977, partial [Pristionchus mayeri]